MDKISKKVNEAAAEIRAVEKIAMENREILTEKAVKNIKSFLLAQLGIMVSNLEMMAIKEKTLKVGEFAIDSEIADVVSAIITSDKPVVNAASPMGSNTHKPKSAGKLKFPRARPEDLEDGIVIEKTGPSVDKTGAIKAEVDFLE